MIHPHKKPVVFFDLDGTIRKPKSGKTFPDNPQDQMLVDGIEDAITHLKDIGYCIVGVTNQGGVAHGFKTLLNVYEECNVTRKLFSRNPFSFILYAPCDPSGSVAPFNQKTFLRKPSTGMIAVAEYKLMIQYGRMIDWEKSLVVGDRDEDSLLAGGAGIRFFHIDKFLKIYKDIQ